MTGLIIFLCVLLIGIIVVQIGRVSEIAGKIRGSEEIQRDANNMHGALSFIFMVVFLVGCVVSAYYYKDVMLGYGPHDSASAHGALLDSIFNITLFFTGIVFILTHIALFYFAHKYRGRTGRKAEFISHDNKLEVIWTIIPAVVMTFLVVGGLDAWNEVMADVEEGEDFMEIEATGMQFAWIVRYPGADGLIGAKNFRKIDATNPLGQDWEDAKNLDDYVSAAPGDVLKLPVGKQIRVRITARDVLHNFYLPHFRVKMDAVPGLPTYFVFTPTVTTEAYRKKLGALDKKGEPLYPEWYLPADESEPDGLRRWEAFQYELACAELCGNGHYSMKRIIEVVSQDEYDEWAAGLSSHYIDNIKGTDLDPYKSKALSVEETRAEEFNEVFEKALAAEAAEDKIIRFKYVNFVTGSYNLTPDSNQELNTLVAALNKYPNMKIEVAGHTDNVGSPANNKTLSQNRAAAVVQFLLDKGISADRMTPVGYGITKPVESNDTAEGRAANRRTEFQIINQ